MVRSAHQVVWWCWGVHVGAIGAIRAVFFCLKDVDEVYALFGEPVGVLVANSDALIVRVGYTRICDIRRQRAFFAVPSRGEVEFSR